MSKPKKKAKPKSKATKLAIDISVANYYDVAEALHAYLMKVKSKLITRSMFHPGPMWDPKQAESGQYYKTVSELSDEKIEALMDAIDQIVYGDDNDLDSEFDADAD